MAGPPGSLLALVLLLAVSGVLSEDGLPKWSQKSSRSNGGWIPIEAPCLTCRAAAEAAGDLDVQASSDFVSAPVKLPPQQVNFENTDFLRPPPPPARVQRQEASRPILDAAYIENQRPPPPPPSQSNGQKQGRDHRFLYTQNAPTRQQFQGFPFDNQQQHIQHPRVVFPTHQAPVPTQQLVQNIQPSRPPTPFLNQQFHQQPAQSLQQTPVKQPQALHQHLQPQQQHQSLQQSQQNQLRPQKQIRFQGVPQDQFPLVLSPSGLGAPHGFQTPQLQLLPIPHAPQPTAAQVNLQNIFQDQLQNQLHHQINQHLLGSPLASPFPTSAIGGFNNRPSPVAPVNVRLVPQQQQFQQPTKASPPPAQKLEPSPSPKPSVNPVTAAQADAPRIPHQQEKQVTTFQANPEEDVEEEVQLLYVPVEALRQRDRVNKQVFQNQNLAAVRQKEIPKPDRQVAHSFEIKHFQNSAGQQFSGQNFQGNQGVQVMNPGPTETENVKANQGQETIVREEKVLSFTPPRVQQFHENGGFRHQTQTSFPTRQFPQQNQDNFRFQSVEQLQQQEQQNPVRQQSHKPQQPISQQFYRQPSVSQEANGQRFYQDTRQVVSPTFPPQTTSRPTTTSPSPTYTTTPEQSSTSPAPYQPPLSVYMEDVEGEGTSKLSVDDVLKSLSGAKSVPVLERAGPNPPKVFVGPSVLRPPKGYAKFELPYLSMLDSNRVERKVDRLPFFVAPLSFQPPSGYAKIPFPAPHVGSVVVSSTPVASTTERVVPVQQSTRPAALPELVNSLQPSTASPSAYTPSIGSVGPTRGTVYPFSSTPQPRPQYDQPQQIYQQYTPQQPIYNQQIYQPQTQHVVSDNVHQNHLLLNQHQISQHSSQEGVSQQQPLPQSPTHSFNYHSTPLPAEDSAYYSSPEVTPPTTTTTTTTTTTPPPQTRAPSHHSRGRTRQRPSYTQTTSSESDGNYRNRGNNRGNAPSDTTRQPSIRTRRPWDGRRRPSTTTTEPSVSADNYGVINADQNYNPVLPLSDNNPSTTTTTDATKDPFGGQYIRESSPSLTQQQYSNDGVVSSSGQTSVSSNEGHLRNQGAVVLSAFQQPQVLGDVITGQIQRPDDNAGQRTYYGGQREYTVSNFDPSPSLGVSPTLPPVQSPRPVTDQPRSVYRGSFEGELKTKEQPRPSSRNKEADRGTAFSGQKGDIYSNYEQPRGQKYLSQQNFRETEAPNAQLQQNYEGVVASVTQGPYVEEQFVVPRGQRVQGGDGGRFRTYQQETVSLKDQNQGLQNVYSTQFTPSVEISDPQSHRQSTPLPEISGVQGNQQQQYYIISTPIPNPVNVINRTYSNEHRFESQQPLLYSQVSPSSNLGQEKNPVSVLVNEGLASKEQTVQDNLGNTYKLEDTSAALFEEELPKTTQATTTSQEPVYQIQTQEEPKRTRYRQPQRTHSSQNTQENSDSVNDERPRYRGHQSRGRQPVQRTRGRHYTTESPSDEEAPSSPQRNVHQRFRGRQRVTAASSTSDNAQSSESLRNPVPLSSTATERAQPESPSEQIGETPEFGINVQDVSQFAQPEEQFGKSERQRPLLPQVSQENVQEVERPVHSRGRTRVRGGDRTASRHRSQYGSFNNDESQSTRTSYSRNPSSGQRYQHTPRRNPNPEVAYQDPPRDHSDDSQQVSLAFDSSPQNSPQPLKTEVETSFSPAPIVIETYEAKNQKDAIRIVQGPGDLISQGVSANQGVVQEQYEQPLASIDVGNDYQEVATIPPAPATTETTTTATVTGKPGRKYGNFVSRVGSPRRQSQATASLNSVPLTTPPPENPQSNKVYTVRPARRPVAKGTSTTRIRIRRPTTPTTTTTSTTTEPSYFLSTLPSVSTQQENPTYDTPSFGSNRGGGFRVRKRPVLSSRRPASAASNEVNEEDQEEPARLQGGYRQRSRVPSRRLTPSSTERTAARWRQTDYTSSEDQQQETGPVSQPAQGFQTVKSPVVSEESYVQPENNEDSQRFQISEEQLASHIPTKALRTQENVEAFNQGPVYQSGAQYYSQESQQSQDGGEIPSKYRNPPVRPTSFAVPDDAVYTYERSRPFSAQQVAQPYDNSPEGAQQKGAYRANQQDFVLNFAGSNRGEETLYNGKDELESGQESRHFDKVKLSKSKDKVHLEEEKAKEETILEESVAEEVQAEREPTDDSQGHSTTVEVNAQTPLPEEFTNLESKEDPAHDVETEKVEVRPLKKVVGGRRRGNWVRVRTKTNRARPDTLETAESQNLASVSQNLLQFTTPLKEKAPAGSWQNTPAPKDFENAGGEKLPESQPSPTEVEEELPETTEANAENYSDLEVGDAGDDHVEDTAKAADPEEDIFEDLENGDFSESDKESPDSEYVSREKAPTKPLVGIENGPVEPENVDPETEDSVADKNASEEKKTSEELAAEEGEDLRGDVDDKVVDVDEKSTFIEDKPAYDEDKATNVDDKVSHAENVTEQPDDVYDQQQEALLEKTEDTTEENGESVTDQSTPRVLGTSTTTEISLETEICYRGRCVKTKVDADQVPVE